MNDPSFPRSIWSNRRADYNGRTPNASQGLDISRLASGLALTDAIGDSADISSCSGVVEMSLDF
jgi:hypothetical protein